MSAAFELDEEGWNQRVADARLSGFDAAEALAPGFFGGELTGAGKGIMQGGAETFDLLGTVGKFLAASPRATEQEEQRRDERVAAADDIQEGLRRDAIDFWTPRRNELGVTGQVLNGLGRIAIPTLAGGGTPFVVAPSITLAEGKRLVDEGVDADTAGVMAAAEGVATYAGFKLPFLGNTLGSRMATGAGGNVLLGGGLAALQNQVLESQGYEELAKQYDPLDPTSRAIDVLLGVAFGGLAHWQTRLPPSERNAITAAANARHFQQDTAPGIPRTPADMARHARAMETAAGQMQRGEPITIRPDDVPRDLAPRPLREAPDNDVWRDVFGEDLPGAPELAAANGPPAVIGEAAIRNPLTFDASPEVKLAELKALTEENVPVVQKIVDSLNEQLAGTESKLNIKADSNILSKAKRPEILAKKPWHGVEHIRDALRFKTVLDRVDQLPGIVKVLKENGIGVEKIDTGKLLTPGPWGWRIVSLDLRMPNGQLVEHYMPVKELEAAKKKGGHQLFEKWRNEDLTKLTPEQRAEYDGDRKKSQALYQEAWESAAARTGLDDTAALASLNSFETSAGSLTSRHSSMSAPVTGTSVRQTPSTRTAETSSDKTTTVSGDSRNLKTDAVMVDSSGRIIPDDAFEAPVISAVKEHLNQQDVMVPTGEVDAEGNMVVKSGRQIIAEGEAAIAKAEQDAKGIEAAVTCFLTRGPE